MKAFPFSKSKTAFAVVLAHFMILNAHAQRRDCYINITHETNELRYSDPVIETNVYSYNQIELDRDKGNFDKNFNLQNGDIVNSYTNLTVGNITTIFNEINRAGIGYDPTIDYSAIRMHFGLRNNSMVIIFEPIYLHPTSQNTCHVVESNIYFWLGPAGFVKIEDPQIKENLAKSYQENVRIDHKYWLRRWRKKFKKGRDSESCILPIQQILRMYCDNIGMNPVDMSQTIKFQIVASNHYKNKADFKLHVVAYYNLDSRIEQASTFTGLGADFAQLCPTNCETVGINYYDH